MDCLGAPQEALAADPVKSALRANTDAALDACIFGLPTMQIREPLLLDNHAHALAPAVLEGAALFEDAEMQRVTLPSVGTARPP